jgi:polyisoprenoid-binding protein YceI
MENVMIRKRILAAVVGASILSGVALAQTDGFVHDPVKVQSGSYVLDPAHGKITWSANHLGFSTYVGQFTDVAGNLDLNVRNPAASKLDATVKIDSVATFNEGLNKHLKTADFFDAAKFPIASFRATHIRLVDHNTAKIAGNLTLRGVTRPIEIEADFNQAGINPVDRQYSLGFDGEAKIKRSDFGINYGLPFVGNEVTLHFEAEFKLKAPAKERV